MSTTSSDIPSIGAAGLTLPARPRSDWGNQRRVMIATSVSYILVIVDTSIVSVGQVRIGAAPPIGVTGLQWVRNFYTLIFASLLLIGSARGDRWGPKRVYTAAIVLFTCALAICPDLPLHSDFAGWARAARREGRLIGAGAYRPAPSC